MRPASRLLPPWQGALFETARLRKQGVATMKLIQKTPSPPRLVSSARHLSPTL
jgi:hypothetical protein